MNGINSRKLLTVAIPTYNRAKNLKSQINALLLQFSEEIQILIIDNCSSFDISKLLEGLDVDSKVKIIRNNVNIGMPANYTRCIEVPDTEWVWTLSDDDTINSDAVPTIISFIKENPQALSICFNSDNNRVVDNYSDFCFLLSNQKTFSMHFWMSVCVYNLSKLKSSFAFGSNNLTTMISPLLMVLKYKEGHADGLCITSSYNLIKDAEVETCWVKYDFLLRLLLIYDIFDKESSHHLFDGVTKFFMISLNDALSNGEISRMKVFFLLRNLFLRQGLIHTMQLDIVMFLKIYLRLLLPKEIILFFKRTYK